MPQLQFDPNAPYTPAQVRTGTVAGPQGNYYAQGISNPPNGGQVTNMDDPEPNDAAPAFDPNAAYTAAANDEALALAASQPAQTPGFWETAGSRLLNDIVPVDAMEQVYQHPETAAPMIGNMIAGTLKFLNPADGSRASEEAESLAASPHPVAAALGDVAALGLGAATAAIPEGAGAVREAALGDPDAAALRGLHVSPQSKFALQTIGDTDAARPFVQGAKGLKDLQAQIPQAKAEVWGPRQAALERIGEQPVKGPDGKMTTVQNLEARRLELSAQLRTLKKGGPDAIALAQQKGLTQANLMREESQINFILDRQFENAGINSQAIRQAYGQLSRLGSRIQGKTTTGEPTQPFGFARLGDVDIKKPFSNFGLLKNAGRDVAAGRYWSQRPTDLNIREAFRPSVAGPKPNFAVLPSRVAGLLERGPIELSGPAASSNPLSQPPPIDATTRAVRLGRLLPAQTGGPIELPYVPEMTGDEQLAALLHYLRNSKPPKGLPAKSSPIRLPAGDD